MVVQTAPAIRVGIGEAMGMEPGSLVTGQMVCRIAQARIFKGLRYSIHRRPDYYGRRTRIDQADHHERCSADDHFLLSRMDKICRTLFPGTRSLISPHANRLNRCSVPLQKHTMRRKLGIDPRKIVVVSVMPCTAKKYEAKRPEMMSAFEYWKEKKAWSDDDAFYDVDYVLTTRELARMFKETGIRFSKLPPEEFDSPLGESTGAAVIFGATGGVMEAALRTAYEVVTGKTLADINFTGVRGMEGIKEAEVDMNGLKVKVAVAHTLKNARVLLEQIERKESPYAFIEVMTCPGGCLGGGGQPIPTTWEIRKKRAESIYKEDAGKPIRKSHENPQVAALYKEFLKEPLGEMSHHLLHTTYTKRGLFVWPTNGKEQEKEPALQE